MTNIYALTMAMLPLLGGFVDTDGRKWHAGPAHSPMGIAHLEACILGLSVAKWWTAFMYPFDYYSALHNAELPQPTFILTLGAIGGLVLGGIHVTRAYRAKQHGAQATYENSRAIRESIRALNFEIVWLLSLCRTEHHRTRC